MKEDEMPKGYHPLFLNIELTPAPQGNWFEKGTNARKFSNKFGISLAKSYLCN